MNLEEELTEEELQEKGFHPLIIPGIRKYYYRKEKVFKCKTWQYEIILYKQVRENLYQFVSKWYAPIERDEPCQDE